MNAKRCRKCGRFISIKEAEESTGRLGDADRKLGMCRKCQFNFDKHLKNASSASIFIHNKKE